MHRTQISLEEGQYERLILESHRLGISLSEMIRRLVSQYLEQQQRPLSPNPLDRVTGIGEGTGEAVGRDHNRFLYGKADR